MIPNRPGSKIGWCDMAEYRDSYDELRMLGVEVRYMDDVGRRRARSARTGAAIKKIVASA
jgi:hypothetical protein